MNKMNIIICFYKLKDGTFVAFICENKKEAILKW